MASTPVATPSTFRRALVAVGVVVVALAGASQLDKLFRGGLNVPLDFAEYWTAGALNADGRDPYSGANVRAVQQSLGLNDTAIMMWNPPWVLTLVMPLGALPFRSAYGVWIVFQLALIVAAVELLWRTYGGPPRLRAVAHLIALTFAPTVFLIGGGQISAVALFGLAGFAYCARADRPLAAGACAALTAVKPHLLTLFALWLILGATRSAFGRRVLLGGVFVGAVACVPPTLANPNVWDQYRAATSGPSSADHNHLAAWKPPVAGWWLRQAVPDRPFAAQWLPLVCATGAFAVWWRQRVEVPDRAGQLPWLVGASLVAAPYGAWMFDLVLLLVPVLAVVARLTTAPDRRAIAGGVVCLVSVNAVSLLLMLNNTSSEWYVWFAPCVLVGCVAIRPTPLGPLPEGKGEKDTQSSVTPGAPEETKQPVTPFPSGRGPGVGLEAGYHS
jgi:hypothetical protein